MPVQNYSGFVTGYITMLEVTIRRWVNWLCWDAQNRQLYIKKLWHSAGVNCYKPKTKYHREWLVYQMLIALSCLLYCIVWQVIVCTTGCISAEKYCCQCVLLNTAPCVWTFFVKRAGRFFPNLVFDRLLLSQSADACQLCHSV